MDAKHFYVSPVENNDEWDESITHCSIPLHLPLMLRLWWLGVIVKWLGGLIGISEARFDVPLHSGIVWLKWANEDDTCELHDEGGSVDAGQVETNFRRLKGDVWLQDIAVYASGCLRFLANGKNSGIEYFSETLDPDTLLSAAWRAWRAA